MNELGASAGRWVYLRVRRRDGRVHEGRLVGPGAQGRQDPAEPKSLSALMVDEVVAGAHSGSTTGFGRFAKSGTPSSARFLFTG